MVNVVDFAVERVLAHAAGAFSFNDALRRNANVSEVQVTYDRATALSSSVTSNCGTSPSLAWERSDDIISLGPLLDTSKVDYSLLEGEIAMD